MRMFPVTCVPGCISFLFSLVYFDLPQKYSEKAVAAISPPPPTAAALSENVYVL